MSPALERAATCCRANGFSQRGGYQRGGPQRGGFNGANLTGRAEHSQIYRLSEEPQVAGPFADALCVGQRSPG